jgi:mono/diheme cytochrome c family protein
MDVEGREQGEQERSVLVMMRPIVVVLTVTLAVAFAPGIASGQNAEDATLVARGMAVYQAQKCMVCHAIDGKGNAKGPLDSVGSRLSAEEIRAWMVDPADMTAKTKAERKPVMRSYPKLPVEDLDALVAYLVSLKKT